VGRDERDEGESRENGGEGEELDEEVEVGDRMITVLERERKVVR